MSQTSAHPLAASNDILFPRQMPEPTDELLKMAGVAHASGNLARAESLANRALEASPRNQEALLLLGVIAGKTGRIQHAIDHLTLVIEANHASFEALFWLSMLHRRQKALSEATTFAERAIEIRPEDGHGRNNLGLCYLDQNRLEEAVGEFKHALKIRPDQPPVLHNLGTALYLLGRDMEAAKAFDRALILAPGNVQSYLSLGQVLLSQTNPGEAAKCARRVLEMNPNSAEAHLLLASALVEDSLTGEAEAHMKQAVALNPVDPHALALLGQRLQSLGKFDEANRNLLKSMELEPLQGFAYFAYVYNNKVTEKDRQMVETMESLVERGDLAPRQLNFLHYGLGRAFEALREHEKAMLHFDEANRIARQLKFGDQVFDREQYSKGFDWLIETFSSQFIETNRTSGNKSELPIVIVGMMRSGTTLTEQILSSHSQVGAAGEQRFWPYSRPALYGEDGHTLRAALLPELGARYVAALKKISPDTARVTDKMPANYEMLGAIHVALPNAHIIHMRRNPVDTCISIYATPNRVPIDFAYDRENIVFAYEQYLRLMEHWRTVLPADRFLEVNYEDMVRDLETKGRRMVEFLGLDWEESLLHHELNQRNVITPSLWQVRQPIYGGSVERWRRYEPWLGAFRKLVVEKIL